jgi:hypothetical protein
MLWLLLWNLYRPRLDALQSERIHELFTIARISRYYYSSNYAAYILLQITIIY